MEKRSHGTGNNDIQEGQRWSLNKDTRDRERRSPTCNNTDGGDRKPVNNFHRWGGGGGGGGEKRSQNTYSIQDTERLSHESLGGQNGERRFQANSSTYEGKRRYHISDRNRRPDDYYGTRDRDHYDAVNGDRRSYIDRGAGYEERRSHDNYSAVYFERGGYMIQKMEKSGRNITMVHRLGKGGRTIITVEKCARTIPMVYGTETGGPIITTTLGMGKTD